jgi:MYXO-CTERM domain-containing protein
VIEDARSDVEGLHRAVLDFTFERTPGAAVTEYAWLAASCDGCESGKGLGADDLLALGAAALPSAEDGSQREVMVDVAESLSRAPEGPPELKRSIVACYGKVLGEMRGLEGTATVSVQTGEGGAVTSAKTKDASAEALGKCIEGAAAALKLDHANANGTIQARFALVSRAYLGAMVLSRLRVRATKGASSALKLRPAAALEGGREEGPTGEPEKKVYFAEHANNFRARYVVRHPWAGPIPCEDPKRGVWGARPKNAPSSKPAAPSSPSGRPTASAAADASGKPATPTAAEEKLATFLAGGALPDLGPYAIPFRAAAPPPSPLAPVIPSSSPAPPAASSGAKSGAGGDCGCRAASAPQGSSILVAVAAIAALAARRRRRKA